MNQDLEDYSKTGEDYWKNMAFHLQNKISEHKKIDEVLFEIAEGGLAMAGDGFFKSAANYISGQLNVKYCMIGILVENGFEKIESIAFSQDGKIISNIEYELKNSPCENVFGKKPCTYPKGVAKLFPKDKGLAKMSIEGYSGVPLFDSKNKPIGLIVALTDKPIEDSRALSTTLQLISVRAAHEVERRITEEKLKSMLRYSIKALGRAAHAFDNETGDHTQRIAELSRELAKIAKYDKTFQDDIFLQAQLHDVGKLYVSTDVLFKPDKLTKKEIEIIKEHTMEGAKIIGNEPHLKIAKDIALFHHEKWDGSGYPFGLKGRSIPIAARIVAIVDVFDAIASDRRYKKAMTYKETFKIMNNGNKFINPEKSFDPELLRLFLDNYELFVNIHKNNLKNDNLKKNSSKNILSESYNDFYT